MKKNLLPCCLILFLTSFSFGGHANAITWQLVDVTFDDGGVATGSFDYDADTNTYSTINIETSGGSNPSFSDTPSYGVPLESFLAPLDSSIFATVSAPLPDPSGDFFAFVLFFNAPLTNAGGTIILARDNSAEAICNVADCNDNIGSRDIAGGTVSAVPVPAAAWLFFSALAGLGLFQRKRTRRAP